MSYRSLFEANKSGLSSSDPKSHTNYKFLQSHQKDARLTQFHQQYRSDCQRIKRLELRIQKLVDERGIVTDEALDEELRVIVAEKTKQISDTHPEGSFARLFWDNQRRAMRLKDQR